jgi:uncharacterized membrane protein YwaF
MRTVRIVGAFLTAMGVVAAAVLIVYEAGMHLGMPGAVAAVFMVNGWAFVLVTYNRRKK